ncbi:uncharacterized protein TRAVEDRAFT_59811 [Trametes versicolor FP-101664 SS1]|uniref:uncharacterized protein n=1 Tax=Trametes versicolor (strain FP-101664) TaxID=717944 RepID=UPI0004623774|nr:uncharacterized protein TRAVEDRAFT_59811 [Trametes versicolor FP-101664 SS1]EIW55484.1 hypothetical protein TRAVEDRAFT_59811 [Trametes versicolor FP-101664 SS1]
MSASSSTASPSRPTVLGLFTRPATPELDIEAQLPQPAPARIHSTRANASIDETASNAVDDFFGASSSRGTRDSRHDDARAATPIDVEALAPPPYECSIEPPAYTTVSDQPTLAMYLFKFGFLFPLFWVVGAFILLSPLQAPSDWETSKPEYERQEIIESMRRTEIKWAKRCLYALLVSILLFAAIAVTAFFVLRT